MFISSTSSVWHLVKELQELKCSSIQWVTYCNFMDVMQEIELQTVPMRCLLREHLVLSLLGPLLVFWMRKRSVWLVDEKCVRVEEEHENKSQTLSGSEDMDGSYVEGRLQCLLELLIPLHHLSLLVLRSNTIRYNATKTIIIMKIAGKPTSYWYFITIFPKHLNLP